MKPFIRCLAAALLPLAIAACDVGSADSVTGNVTDSSGTTYNFSGTYYPVDNAETLVNPPSMQSGQLLTWIRLVQYGSKLEGFDNAKKTWSGKISSVSSSGNASFSLSGSTTTGHSVDIVGTLHYSDSSSIMDGSWIEDVGNAAAIYAKAAVAPPSTNSPSPAPSTLAISPSSYTLAPGSSKVFTVSGATGTCHWTLSTSSYGVLSSTSGTSTTFTAFNNASDATLTLTVADSSSSASASITIATP